MADLETALEKLLDAINHDVNGVPGMPLSGNGGLVSEATIRAADEARLTLYRHRRSEREREGVK